MRFKLNPVRKVATMMHWCWLMDIFERKYICSVFVRVLLWFGIHCSTLCASIICVVVVMFRRLVEFVVCMYDMCYAVYCSRITTNDT